MLEPWKVGIMFFITTIGVLIVIYALIILIGGSGVSLRYLI